MAKFYIDYQLKVTTARVIEAETEEDAIRIAEQLTSDDDYWDGIINSMEEDCDNFWHKNVNIICFGNANDSDIADNE